MKGFFCGYNLRMGRWSRSLSWTHFCEMCWRETDLPPKCKAFQKWKAFFVLIIYFRQSELVSDSHKAKYKMMRFRNEFGMTLRFCTWLFLKWRPIFHPNSKRFRNGMFLCSRFNFHQSELVQIRTRRDMKWCDYEINSEWRSLKTKKPFLLWKGFFMLLN